MVNKFEGFVDVLGIRVEIQTDKPPDMNHTNISILQAISKVQFQCDLDGNAKLADINERGTHSKQLQVSLVVCLRS